MTHSLVCLVKIIVLILLHATVCISFTFGGRQYKAALISAGHGEQYQVRLFGSKDEVMGEDLDYTALEVDSPLFLDMPWPVETGPAASAFAKHMQWKRKLSDGERLRWQRWAVYQRMKVDNKFQFSLEDYVTQNMQHELSSNALKQNSENDSISSAMYSATMLGMKSVEAQEVKAVMTAYYSAFNRRNFDELRALWLPDENAELTFPGYERVRGDQAIEKLYQKLVTESAPMGSVKAAISSVQCYGNVAMVHTVEEVQAGSALKSGGRKRGAAPDSPEPKRSTRPRRVLATTILRKAHKQWRILSHHAVRMWSSPYTGDSVDVSFTRRDARVRAELMRELDKETQAQSASNPAIGGADMTLEEVERLLRSTGVPSIDSSVNARKLGEGTLRPILRQRPDGTFERVITLDAPASAVEDVRPGKTGSYTVPPAVVASGGGASGAVSASQSTSKRTNTSTSPPDNSVAEAISSVIGGSAGHTTTESKSSARNKGAQKAVAGRSAELAVDTGIDEDATVSKQAVQAVRRLHQERRLSKEDRELLIADVVSCLAQDKSSLVEVAYEMLYAYPVHENEQLEEEKAHLSNFADQCDVILGLLHR